MSLEKKSDIFLFAFDRLNVLEKVQHIIDKRHVWQLL